MKFHQPSFSLTLFLTWFGLGKLPKMPGTWGSLGALPLIWLLHDSLPLSITVIIGLFVLSWIAIAFYIKDTKIQDPQEIVIDEVIGQWIALLGAPQSVGWFTVGFILFRFFDIVKPFPVSWADNLKGSLPVQSLGILLDDLLAGLMALGVLHILLYFLA